MAGLSINAGIIAFGKMVLNKPMRLTPGNQTSHILWAVLILLVVLIALASAMPVLYPMPDTDASIFLFIGDKIKSGQLPFRDWYDHKPPLIFYLNALGLWLGQGSRWGVWAIYISAAAAALLGFVFLRRYYGKWIAALAVSATLMNLAFVFQRGNLTEEYALPFQFGVLLLLAGVDQGQKKTVRLLLIGLALSLASSLKQPLAGTGVAVAIYLFVYYGTAIAGAIF